ncbi:MmcQ/YjbR family DNA-binding protein [Lactobacillus terrae]|uniref:MmcQ/YjbR family DNA-binding protein n=1 Tax=Lactobacillus terrae TaxID=2269374 RepID=UPI000C1B78A3|nr:MmcQ/YjbR family DNA-binding protein [Lactobacillus terrae]
MKIKDQVLEYIKTEYGEEITFPFKKFPEDGVFRHSDHGKWFALIMTISADKIGLDSNEKLDILDVKVDPEILGSLRKDEGFYPGYHMNKDYWITIVLDSTVSLDKITPLIDMSFELTK